MNGREKDDEPVIYENLAEFEAHLDKLTLEGEREQIRRGICPRSGKRIMPDGILRPFCSFCECGEES